jgi:hypothetical protein
VAHLFVIFEKTTTYYKYVFLLLSRKECNLQSNAYGVKVFGDAKKFRVLGLALEELPKL